jgi:hypothetical protein
MQWQSGLWRFAQLLQFTRRLKQLIQRASRDVENTTATMVQAANSIVTTNAIKNVP